VVGFQVFPAQKTIGLIFCDAAKADLHVGAAIGDTGLYLYPAPPAPAKLLKLTLQGVPVHRPNDLKDLLATEFQRSGTLVSLVPMVKATTGWMSDQWHATVKLHDGETVLPPALITVLDKTVIVDVPGERRYCRHCQDTTHVKPNCRQGQRLRARAQQLLKHQQQQDQQQQQQKPDELLVIPHPSDAFGDDYTPPPKPNPTHPKPTTTTNATNSDVMDNWEMEVEMSEDPETFGRRLQEAMQMLEYAEQHPGEVSDGQLALVRAFLAANNATTGSGGEYANQ
jgi:hypothetical protein